MAGDGILQLGATIDKTGVDQGLSGIGADVKTAVQSIAVQVEETVAKSRAAWNKLGDDVKAAAQTVSAESLKVAEATKAQAAALGDLRRASTLSRDAKLDEAETTALLAAAQQKAASAAATVAAAKQEEAAAVAAANEEEMLSENFLVAAFQRAGIGIRESLTLVQEKMAQTAEEGQLSASGIAAGFGGLGSLLGAGIVVGFATHYLDELAKINVELDHLATKTGISITALAGLQQILKEAGGDFETVATGLVRMESNTEKLAQHNKALEEAFTNLGLKIEDVRAAKPEELLQMIATGMANTADANIRANSAITIFGRGGQALIPVLREQGAQLTANIQATGALTGVTNESALAARRWTEDTARLSAQFRSVMMPVMEHAEDVVRGVMGAFDTAAAVIVSGLEAIATALLAAYAPLAGVAVLLKDVFTGNWGAIKADAQAQQASFVNIWKAGFAEIQSNWAVVKHDFTYSSPVPPAAGGTETPEIDDTGTGPAKSRGSRAAALQRDTEQLNEMRLEAETHGHRLSLLEEINFWQGKLNEARKGTEEYRGIVAKLADLKEKALKGGGAAASPQQPQTVSLDTSSIDQQVIKGLQAQAAAAEKAAHEALEVDRDSIGERMRLAQESYRNTVQDLQQELGQHRITKQQELAAERDAANQEYQIELGLARQKEALDMGERRAYARDLASEVQLTREHDRQLQQLAQQSAQQTAQAWQQAFQKISSSFNDAVGQWVTTGQGFQQSMVNAMRGITENFTKNMLQMTEQFLLGLATQKGAMKSQIVADAKMAAANAYQNVVRIPYVGPFLAPAAAAAAFAGVMAFESFDSGGVVGNRMGLAGMGGHVPVLAEAGERVLTPSQSRNFDTLVNQRSSSSSARLNQTNNFSGGVTKEMLDAHTNRTMQKLRGMLRPEAFA